MSSNFFETERREWFYKPVMICDCMDPFDNSEKSILHVCVGVIMFQCGIWSFLGLFFVWSFIHAHVDRKSVVRMNEALIHAHVMFQCGIWSFLGLFFVWSCFNGIHDNKITGEPIFGNGLPKLGSGTTMWCTTPIIWEIISSSLSQTYQSYILHTIVEIICRYHAYMFTIIFWTYHGVGPSGIIAVTICRLSEFYTGMVIINII